MKKKLLVLVLAIVMTVTAVGCGRRANNEEDTVNQVTDDTADRADVDAPTDVEDEAEPIPEGTFAFDAPEGFVLDEEVGAYIGPNYPDEGSNINTSSSENDGSFADLTTASLTEAIEAQFVTAYNETIEITVSDEGYTDVDGYEAFWYIMEYEFMDNPVSQLQYIVNGTNNLYFITFTNMNDEPYMDAFKASAETIRFE